MELPHDLQGKRFYFVGIKGTGMAALAELLTAQGALVSGSDVDERFFTDEILESLGLTVHPGFREENLQLPIDFVVHSAAYNPESHPELVKARNLGLPVLVYTEALGAYSQRAHSAGICGVHGKTTTTAMTGLLMRALNLPFSVLAGSLVPDFGNRATLTLGSKYFVAETCEYKRHFLSFHPSRILLTSIELDHTDYFKDEADIFLAFEEYIAKLPSRGTLVWCADEKGAAQMARLMAEKRPDLVTLPYGKTAVGRFSVAEARQESGRSLFRLGGWKTVLELRIPGSHNILNAAGAAALALSFWENETGRTAGEDQLAQLSAALAGFKGSRRRSQIVGEAGGVLVMDDYGHHPTAVDLTIQGIKDFYPGRRLVVDFMSHTYSRTKSLLEEFASSFSAADEVILHKIYASARETSDLGISGRTLYDAACRHHPNVKYFDEIADAVPYFRDTLKPGDILLTMGAGDNWKAGTAYLQAKGVQP